MLAVFKRELQSYFYSPIGYVFIGIFVFAAGIMFTMVNLLSQSSDMNSTFDNMIMVYMLLIPILTMKLMSDDRKTKADQLLFTSPIPLWSIVMGKFLAACAVFLISMSCMVVYAVIIAMYGTLSLVEVLVSSGGLLLMTFCYISIGVLMSTLTENQISAAALTFVTIFGMWLSGYLAPSIGVGIISDILNFISIYNVLSVFTQGILSVSAVVYMISFTAVFLFLTVRVIERRRWSEG